MDGKKMAPKAKKRGPIEQVRGRPAAGSLSTYTNEVVQYIKAIRQTHPGWGALNILVELEEEYHFDRSILPSIASLNRYLQEQGLIKKREPRSKLPTSKGCVNKVKKPHDRWELDAQGAVLVARIGHQALINIKDAKSRLHCMAFPVSVRNSNSQPSKLYYQWALRIGFMERGLPKAIQVDKDSVFIESRSKSPFPKGLHLWLIGLGVELCFIKEPPPINNAMVERSHQTMERQVIEGQDYACWRDFFQYCQKRRARMNEKIPNRSLDNKPPLKAFPNAIHSGRPFDLAKEDILIDLKRIYRYLTKGKWYRLVSKAKTVSLGNQTYYLKNAKPGTDLQIHFCNRAKKLVFRDANELVIAKLPLRNLSVQDLMGASVKQLCATWYKLNHLRACPF